MNSCTQRVVLSLLLCHIRRALNISLSYLPLSASVRESYGMSLGMRSLSDKKAGRADSRARPADHAAAHVFILALARASCRNCSCAGRGFNRIFDSEPQRLCRTASSARCTRRSDQLARRS